MPHSSFFSGIQKYQVSALISGIIPVASGVTTGSNSRSHVHAAAIDFMGALERLLLSCYTKSLLHHLAYLGTRGISPAQNERFALSIIS